MAVLKVSFSLLKFQKMASLKVALQWTICVDERKETKTKQWFLLKAKKVLFPVAAIEA
jgi:hypothetical protein